MRMTRHSKHRVRDVWPRHGRQPHQTAHSSLYGQSPFGSPSSLEPSSTPGVMGYVTGKKHVVCNRSSLCVVLLVRTYIACTRVQTMSICPNLYNTTLEAPGTQLLAMLLFDFFWGSNRNHYYLLLVLSCVLLPPPYPCMYVYLPKFNT